MKKLLTLSFLTLLSVSNFAQQIELVFTGKEATTNAHVQLSRIEITDLTRGWTETLTWPDTVAILTAGTYDNTGLEENASQADFGLSQNTPNPFMGATDVNLNLTESGTVTMEITDVNGRMVMSRNFSNLHPGCCQFRVNVSKAGAYFLSVRQNGKTSSVKMVNNGNGGANGIEYVGNSVEPLRATALQQKNGTKGTISRPFECGDAMTYKGFVIVNGKEIEGKPKTQTQEQSGNITLFVNTPGYPCPGVPTVTDIDSNTYNTVKIGSQCWMAENLRTTKYADGTSILRGNESTSTTIGYWYYPNNDSTNKSTYGLMYNWKAVMRDSASSSNIPSGVQGICPTGWHVPSKMEWMQLMGYVSSEVSYCCGGTSTYIAKALASTTGWSGSGNKCAVGTNPDDNNVTGFGAFPAGCYSGSYTVFGASAYIWSATEEDNYLIYDFNLYYGGAVVASGGSRKYYGLSVRCLRD